MRNVEHTISTKVSADDKAAIALFADAEHIKPSEFLRREIRKIIQERQRGFSLDELILAELLAFKETVLTILKDVLADKSVSRQRVDDLKALFDKAKAGLAEDAIRGSAQRESQNEA